MITGLLSTIAKTSAAQRTSIWRPTAVLSFLASAFLVPALSHANVGRTPATFGVSADGGAQYTIPIWTPPGPNGLEPHIALQYDSHGGDGDLGVGWSLTGISAITRCNKTVAQDGAAAPITLASSDGYCLDGERLRLVSGTYGASGSVYETEVENFEQVTMYGSAGNGPAYFEVKDRNGVTYEYGNGGNSQVTPANTGTPWQWWLDKVTDPAGNTLTISYQTANASGEVVPATISWTPSSYGSSSYDDTIQFAYTTDSAAASTYGYVAGAQVDDTNRLTSINVEYQGSTVRDYFLSYGVSATTSREELTSLQECADAAQSNCLAPTTFQYQSVPQGDSAGAVTAVSATAVEVSAAHTDFTGNGADDLAYCNGGSPNTLNIVFGSPNGYGAPVSTGIPCTRLFGDLTGDGKDGILAPNGTDWYYYSWNGSSFTGQDTGLVYDSSASQYVLADVNGDGLPDLIAGYLTQTLISRRPLIYQYTYTIDVRMNTSSGGTPSFAGSQSAWYSLSNESGISAEMISDANSAYGEGPIRHLDFNGDGRQDLALEMAVRSCISCTSTNLTYYELVSGSSGFSATAIASVSNSSFLPVEFLNFNSDKCTDYAVESTIYISGCNGAAPQTIALPSGTHVIGAMDWNGDGHTDILVQNGSTIGVYLSEGNALDSSLISTSIPYDSAYGYFTFDPYGDGLEAIGAVTNSGIIYYPNNAQDEPPDLLTKITDGYGNWTEPSYVSLADAGGTYSADGGAPSGYEDYMGPYYVVRQVTFSDPSNPPSGTYTRTYSYYGAEESLNGRGFAGFGARYVLDSRNNLYTSTNYDHVFPYTGMVQSEIVTEGSGGGQRVSYRSNSLADQVSGPTDETVYFPYVSQSTSEHYGISGSDNGSIVTTRNASFSYDGTSGDLTSSSQTLTDNDASSPYYGDSWSTSVSNTPAPNTSTWCLSLLSASTVSYTDTYDNASVSETRNFNPDTTNCRYSSIVTAPSTAYQVTDALGYDSFGNINSETVTGIGMTGRTTSMNWGTTGQFPLSITNALNQTTTFNYDFGCGLVSSMTDPNGDATSWQYGEGFCRLTQETRPDGTYTTWSYTLYSGSDPKPRMLVTSQIHDTSGNLIRTMTEEFDQEDRPYLEQTNLLSGATATVMQKSYDALGRVISAQEPYEGSTVGAVTYSYDLLNRVTAMQRPTSASDSTPATTSYQYDGLTTTVTDPNGDTRTLVYDPNGWLRRSTDDLGYTVIFGYDAAGSRTSVSDNQGNTLWSGTWEYGIRPFLVGTTDMDMGSWGYTVDPLGEVIAWTDAKGQHFAASYDALSRPETRSEPDLFTQWTWGSSASAHNMGHLAAVCTGTGANPSGCTTDGESEQWTYDGDGRLSTRTITLPSVGSYTYTWQYSASTGLLSSLTYPMTSSGNALTLTYGYAYGYLQSITDTLASPNITVWSAGSMNPAGQITQATLGNGLTTTRTYDAVTHLLTAVQSGVGGGTAVQNQSYLYDADGNLTERQNNNLGLTENFYYDGDNRLSYSTLNGTRNLSLTYDAMGNITSRSDVANGASWTYDSTRKHQVMEAGSTAYQYAYDANGNMTSWMGNTVNWTSYNYPSFIADGASGESVTFSYGPNRTPWLEATQEPSGTTETYRVGRLMSMVNSGSGLAYRNYIYAGNDPVAVDTITSSGETLQYFETGPQRSIDAITNSAGQVLVNESFSAYGVRRDPTTWSGAASSADLATSASITQHGYTFQRALGEEMNLNDMVGRVEDAGIGRFMSADPTMPDPYSPQSYNPYSYVANNPMTYIDPSGFCGVTGENINNLQIEICPQDSRPVPPPRDNPLLSGGGRAGGGDSGADGSGGVRGTPGKPTPVPKGNQKTCVSPAVRIAQGLVGAGEAIGGLVQAIGGAADILASVAGAPETLGASLLATAPGAASLTLGSATLGDGLSLIHAAFTGSGNAPTLEGAIGQQYGGANGQQVGDLVGVGGQVVSAALSPARTAETAAANAAMMALSNVLPNAGTVCGQ